MKQQNIRNLTELLKISNIALNQLLKILSNQITVTENEIEKFTKSLKVNFEDIIAHDELNNREGQFVDTSSVIANKVYNLVELFAGAGGLALGLEYAGFNVIGLVENDSYACATLRRNRPTWNVIERDIVQVAEIGIRKFLQKGMAVDIISGGYPCQPFSYAGHKMGLSDVRGNMFYYYTKILYEVKPKVFLAENVKGLVSIDNGKTLQLMIDVFEGIGYNVECKVLNALDYNVAQKRERVIIVGTRSDISKDTLFYYPKPYDYKPVLKDVLKNVPYSIGAEYPENKEEVLALVPAGGFWKDLPDNIAREYMGRSYHNGGGKTGFARRLSWEEPCLTLTCSPSQKQTERCHPDETRPFTTREYARIQSFPDEWVFEGSMTNIYKQIGNAVPVNLAKEIGLSLIDYLNRVDIE